LPLFEASINEAARNSSTEVLVFDLALNFARDLGGDKGLQTAADVLIKARKDSGKAVAVVLYSRASDLEDLGTERILRALRWKLLGGGVPVFPSMRRATRAIALANR
jgi:hypothetical protein